ncbi:transposase, partial [Granulicatella balaenopterae]
MISSYYHNKHKVVIKYVETDKDHIHYMIETRPNINLSNLV